MSGFPDVIYAWTDFRKGTQGRWNKVDLSVYYGETQAYVLRKNVADVADLLEQNKRLKFERDYANDMLGSALEEIKRLEQVIFMIRDGKNGQV